MTVTPARLRVLASRAEALAAEVRTLCDGVPATAPEHGHLAEARQATDWLARGVEGLRRAADDLATLQEQPCGLPWGVCPEHGNTLEARAGITTCRVCQRTWNHDRLHRPCADPVTWKVIDRAGGETRMCDGHVLGARAAAASGATFLRLGEATVS